MIYCDILQYKATNAELPYKASHQQVQTQPEPYITYNISMLTNLRKIDGWLYCNTALSPAAAAASLTGYSTAEYDKNRFRIRVTIYGRVRLTKFRSKIKTFYYRSVVENFRIILCLHSDIILQCQTGPWAGTTPWNVVHHTLTRTLMVLELHIYVNVLLIATHANFQVCLPRCLLFGEQWFYFYAPVLGFS